MSSQLQSVARVFVKCKTGERTGTCYPIAKNRVVTADHVLGEKRVGETAEILWCEHPDTVNQDWLPATIIWRGRKDEEKDGVDLAIMETEFPNPISGFAPFSIRPPNFQEKFESRGFPDVGRSSGKTKPVAITGTVQQHMPRTGRCDLGIDYEPSVKSYNELRNDKEEKTLWKGASGSPLIIEGRFVGVLTMVPTLFADKRMYAIPFSDLRSDRKFQEAARFDDQSTQIQADYREGVAEEVAELLASKEKSIENLLSLIAEYPSVDTSRISDRVDPEQRSRLLANEICGLNEEDFISSVHRFADGKSGEDLVIAVRLFELVLPLVFGDYQTRILPRTDESGLLRIKAASDTVAELVQAAIEKRAASFAIDQDGSDNLPRGKRAIPVSYLETAEEGPHSDATKKAETVLSELAQKT